MKNNMLLIINPKAGKGKIKKKLPQIIKKFEEQNYIVKTEYTQKGIKTKNIVEQYEFKIDLIVCCGGDGTLNQIINEIMSWEIKPKLGFIPLGTMNDFARTLKISTKKTYLSKNINEAKIVHSDIGTFNDIYFNYVSAFGVFTDVSYKTSQTLKKKFGKLAYIIAGIKSLKEIKSYKIELEVDEENFEDEFIYGGISNSKSIGGFKWFKDKDVKIDDGKYEIIFIKKPKKVSGYLGIIKGMLLKKYTKKHFIYLKAKKIKIKSEKNIPWTLDGEYGGKIKEVTILNNKKAIKYIVP